METVILARHGESVRSVERTVNGDPSARCPLTPAGVDQARRLGELIADVGLDLCVVTRFERTVETADVALADRSVPRVVVPELDEGSYGSFEGGSLDEYLEWARGQTASTVPPGPGESRAQMAARFARGFREVLALDADCALVVGHSLPLCYALGAVDGERPAPVMPQLPYAEPHAVSGADLARAVGMIEAWAADPTW
jgi:broad specificity phosphatase PhoE